MECDLDPREIIVEQDADPRGIILEQDPHPREMHEAGSGTERNNRDNRGVGCSKPRIHPNKISPVSPNGTI